MSDLHNEQTALTATSTTVAALDLPEDDQQATEEWPVEDESTKDPFVGRSGTVIFFILNQATNSHYLNN